MAMVANGASRKTYLRQTLFQEGKSPITSVIEEGSLKEDIHIVANETRRMFGTSVDVEIFQWDGDLISATVEAHRRASAGRIPESERRKEVLHDHLVWSFFMTRPGGVVAPKSITPMTADDIKGVLERAKNHREYKGQAVLLISEDGMVVRLSDGKISAEEMP